MAIIRCNYIHAQINQFRAVVFNSCRKRVFVACDSLYVGTYIIIVIGCIGIGDVHRVGFVVGVDCIGLAAYVAAEYHLGAVYGYAIVIFYGHFGDIELALNVELDVAYSDVARLVERVCLHRVEHHLYSVGFAVELDFHFHRHIGRKRKHGAFACVGYEQVIVAEAEGIEHGICIVFPCVDNADADIVGCRGGIVFKREMHPVFICGYIRCVKVYVVVIAGLGIGYLGRFVICFPGPFLLFP